MKALKPKTETISVPPRPVAGEFCAAINRLNESRADVVAIRAGSLRFLSPLEICGLRALLGYAAELVERVEFECPADPNVHNYLERMNLYAELPANVTLSRSRPRLRRRDLCEQLIELTPIATVEDVEELMERVNVVARAHSGNRRLAKALQPRLPRPLRMSSTTRKAQRAQLWAPSATSPAAWSLRSSTSALASPQPSLGTLAMPG